MTLSLNGVSVTSLRLTSPWSGAWAADVELDLGDRPTAPSGPATLLIDTTPLVGTIDPGKSGTFGPRARARVVGGARGWEQTVSPMQYHNDAGVLSTAVLATTAAEVGERILEVAPRRLGIDFVRRAGPAARVLDGFTWYLNNAGVTVVGPRIPTPATPALEIIDWDPRQRVATIATTGIVSPGTILADPKFGTAKIRDVEQTWGNGGSRARAWTIGVDETPGPGGGGELLALVGAIARDAVGAPFLATVRYIVGAQLPDGRFVLAPASPKRGLPPLKAISLAPAIPGMSVMVPPGTVAHVVFVDGDRNVPVVVGFEKGSTPLSVKIDSTLVHVGTGTAPSAGPVALAAPTLTALNALKTAVAAALAPIPGGAAVAATLEAAMASVATTVPSTKLFSE